MEEEVRDELLVEEEGGWIDEQSPPPPPPPTKISIKRPGVAAPCSSVASPSMQTDAALVSKKGGHIPMSAPTVLAGVTAGALREGLQARLFIRRVCAVDLHSTGCATSHDSE
jgi:hypothetical protein